MHGLVLTDDRGDPLSPFISWLDQRALEPHPSGQASCFDLLMRQIDPQEQQETGNELYPGRPVCALFWLASQRRLPAAAIPAALADFVLARLCASPPASEVTNASAHGIFRLTTGDWHYPLIARLGLDRLRWPSIRRPGEVVGCFPAASRRIPCYTPVGDQQCALVGALLTPDELSLNIATGAQVSLIVPQLRPGDYQTRPFFDDQWLNTITGVPAGRALNALLALLSELATGQGVALPDPWAYIAQAVAGVETTDLRVNLAFFPSVRGDRGEIANLHEGNLTVGHLFRAAFHDITENVYASALRLSPQQSWRRLVLSGGLAHNSPVLRHLIQRRFQAECRLCPSTEDTLLGLLALALAFSGKTQSVQQAVTRLRQRYNV